MPGPKLSASSSLAGAAYEAADPSGAPSPCKVFSDSMRPSSGAFWPLRYYVGVAHGAVDIDRLAGLQRHRGLVLGTDPNGLFQPVNARFVLDANSKPERITKKAVSPIADFSFDYQDLLFTRLAGK